MKRYSLIIFTLILAVFVFSAILVVRKFDINTYFSLKHKPSESEILISANSLAVSQANAQSSDVIPIISDQDYSWGKNSSALNLVVYEDFTNQYSVEYDKILKIAQEEFGDNLNIYFRPYFEFDNSLALNLQIAAVCAGQDGKFLEMREWLFSQEQLNESRAVDGAKDLGLNVKRFSDCLKNQELRDKIVGSVEKVRSKVVFGAPTSFINNEVIVGARSMDDIVNSAGENVEGLREIINRHILAK